MALDLDIPTPAVVQSFIHPPTSNAVRTPARNDARKLTRRFGITFKSTANAIEEKNSVTKKPKRRDVRSFTRESPTHRV